MTTEVKIGICILCWMVGNVFCQFVDSQNPPDNKSGKYAGVFWPTVFSLAIF